jgi:GGDEF domain-containing protein
MIAAMPPRPASGRPRPVADRAVDALARDPEELARRWLVALMESRSLADAAALPVAELASAGPALCAAVIEAVRSDDALDALPAGSAAALLARVAGSGGGPATVTAAEALRRAASEAAAAEIPHADAAVLAALSDRLAHVCAHLAAAAMSIRAPAAVPEAASTQAAPRPAAEMDGPVTDPPPSQGTVSAEDDPSPAPPIELRVSRAADETGPAPLWLAALERQLADGGRFALLLVEVDGADRLWLAEGDDAARELFARVGRAVRTALRRVDLLAHEQDGRLWVIAPDAGRNGATALAMRVASAVEAAASARNAPLTASVGIALYPDDGRDTESLTGQAEESALAARAAGVRVSGRA